MDLSLAQHTHLLTCLFAGLIGGLGGVQAHLKFLMATGIAAANSGKPVSNAKRMKQLRNWLLVLSVISGMLSAGLLYAYQAIEGLSWSLGTIFLASLAAGLGAGFLTGFAKKAIGYEG